MDPPADPPAHLPPPVPLEEFSPGKFRDSYYLEPEEDYAPPTVDEARLNALLMNDRAPLEQEGHSLPTLDEVRNSNFFSSSSSSSSAANNPYSGRRKRMWALLCVGLVVLSVIVAISVSLSMKNNSTNNASTGSSSELVGGSTSDNSVDTGDSDNSVNIGDSGNSIGNTPSTGDIDESDQDTTDPLRNPDSNVQVKVSRYDQVVEYIVAKGITSVESFGDENGPQYAAAMWIADYDPIQLPIPSPSNRNHQIEQRYIMATFYYALDGPNWLSSLKFLSRSSVCEWNVRMDVTNELGKQKTEVMGVSCGDTGNVEILLIAGNELSGEIPSEFGYLTSLWHLSLYDNSLNGELPNEMQRLTNLWFVGMEENNLEGVIPDWINQWTNLEFLALGANWFSGSLPSFAGMGNLTEISLHDNNFTGSIDVLNVATSLSAIFLNHNSFESRIDSSTLVNLDKLQTLDLSDNLLTGSFPEHFYRIKNVVLAENSLSGELPDVEIINLPIEVLSIHHNSFVGNVPTKIGLLSNLVHLDLSHNQFDGQMFDSINGLTKLQFLLLSYNPFQSGRIPVMSSLTNLLDLSLGGTDRSGKISTVMGTLTNLRLLDLHNNDLTGTIPSQLAKLPNLRFLDLKRNLLTGRVPNELADIEGLLMFHIDHNSITGNVGAICFNGSTDHLKKYIADCNVDCPCCTEGTCCAESDDSCNKEELSTNFRAEYVKVEFVFSGNVFLNATS